MNREIKFRIWADNKFYNKCLVGNTNNSKSDEWTCPMVWLEKTKKWVHCDNGVICQFTGLHDKNGKEIYEGDILKISDVDTAIVQWDKEYASFIAKPVEDFYFDNDVLGCAMGNNSAVEVIGNIYENPELLGGKNE